MDGRMNLQTSLEKNEIVSISEELEMFTELVS